MNERDVVPKFYKWTTTNEEPFVCYAQHFFCFGHGRLWYDDLFNSTRFHVIATSIKTKTMLISFWCPFRSGNKSLWNHIVWLVQKKKMANNNNKKRKENWRREEWTNNFFFIRIVGKVLLASVEMVWFKSEMLDSNPFLPSYLSNLFFFFFFWLTYTHVSVCVCVFLCCCFIFIFISYYLTFWLFYCREYRSGGFRGPTFYYVLCWLV